MEIKKTFTEFINEAGNIKKDFPKGSMVKPLKKNKRKKSSWISGFANKKYKVIDYDSIDGEDLIVVQTGDDPEMDYEVLYPDEVEKV